MVVMPLFVPGVFFFGILLWFKVLQEFLLHRLVNMLYFVALDHVASLDRYVHPATYSKKS